MTRHFGGAPSQQRQPQTQFPSPPDQELRRIVEDGDYETLVRWAEQIGKALADPNIGMTSSQIRGIFGTVRRIEMRWPETGQDGERAREAHRELLLLRPKLAYQAKREGKGVPQLASVLDRCIPLVGTDRERFKYFVDFFEAILAYHRAHGGK